ncbi:uncharacterized protein [Paralichthys olivaceus]|uniref:uncharacterized protein isoform X2 n=1 Tax=Paralichthys olivaceus TaxID=8255 RepID=UPI00097D722D|nr:PREDICTED: uncharacterized protein LOC109628394 [Paralichthys olivaceus]
MGYLPFPTGGAAAPPAPLLPTALGAATPSPHRDQTPGDLTWRAKVTDLIGPITMGLHLITTACLLFARITITHQSHMNSVYMYLFTPRGPQMFPCLTYLEKNVRVDCEFPPTYQVPGPYCEYRQDSRLVGSTYPNAVTYVSHDDRRRSNVSLVTPSLCRLTWAPMDDEKPFTYTCRVYQGSSWKENSMAVHHRILPICSAISVMFQSAPWLLSLVMSLPVAVGLLSP